MKRNHHCHFPGCKVETVPERLMCYEHWRKVPQYIQRKVWLHYQKGQCNGKVRPKKEWFDAVREAIEAIQNPEPYQVFQP